MSAYKINQFITRSCIGTSVAVYLAWSYADRADVYRSLDHSKDVLRSKGFTSLPRNLPVESTQDVLHKYFVLKASEPQNILSWFGSSLSHRDLSHLAFNLFTWASFAPILHGVPGARYPALLVGSAMAASGSWLIEQRGKPNLQQRSALGSSGVVSGVLTAITCMIPRMQARLLGIIPLPLWAMTGGFILIDTWSMQSGRQSGIGHSAHLGGCTFGGLFYLVFLRRYGIRTM